MIKVTFETRSQKKYLLYNLLSYQMVIKWFTVIYFHLKQTRIKDWWKKKTTRQDTWFFNIQKHKCNFLKRMMPSRTYFSAVQGNVALMLRLMLLFNPILYYILPEQVGKKRTTCAISTWNHFSWDIQITTLFHFKQNTKENLFILYKVFM